MCSQKAYIISSFISVHITEQILYSKQHELVKSNEVGLSSYKQWLVGSSDVNWYSLHTYGPYGVLGAGRGHRRTACVVDTSMKVQKKWATTVVEKTDVLPNHITGPYLVYSELAAKWYVSIHSFQ